MGKRGLPLVSPCVDVCSYKDGGFCKACKMTKDEKKAFKSARSDAQTAFIGVLLSRFGKPKKGAKFIEAYRKKCGRGGSIAGRRTLEAIDRVEAEAAAGEDAQTKAAA